MITCRNCGLEIVATAAIDSPTGYLHPATNRVCCFDVYKPEYATPATQPATERN